MRLRDDKTTVPTAEELMAGVEKADLQSMEGCYGYAVEVRGFRGQADRIGVLVFIPALDLRDVIIQKDVS